MRHRERDNVGGD